MKVKVKERVNWPITILLILGLVTVIFPESYHCQKAGAFLTLQKQCV